MGGIFTLRGVDHKCGTSQLAQCSAELLAKSNPKLKVLLVLPDDRGLDYCKGVRETIDRIRPYAAEKLIDTDEIIARSFYRKNLHIIGGSVSPHFSDLLSPDMSEYFIKSLAEYFDIVIVDASSDLTEELTLASLFAASRRYFVFNQCESSLRRYEWSRVLCEKLEIMPDVFILNKYDASVPYNKRYIRNRLKYNGEIITVRKHRQPENAEIKNESLIKVSRPGLFKKDIEKLVGDILTNAKTIR